MTSTKPTTRLSSRTDTRLTAYVVAAGAALAAPAAVTTTEAAIVYVDPPDISVPNNLGGIYLNLLTGATGTSGSSTPGYDFNPYGSGGALNFFSPTGGGVVGTGTTASVLTLGTVIGPGSTFVGSIATGTPFRVSGTELLGLRFTNEATGAIDYGWVELSTTATTGFPATITRYAYDNAGTAIAAGAVPEPTTTALLGALAAGAVGVRQWRRRRPMAA